LEDVIVLTILSLRPLDIIVLKKLGEIVNVIPVIAKCDTLTLDERAKFKERVC
jgi:septin 3/9/12